MTTNGKEEIRDKKVRRKFKFRLKGYPLLAVTLLGIVFLWGVGTKLNIIPPVFSSSKETNSTQVVKSLKQEKEIALLSLGIADIYDQKNTAMFFNKNILGTQKVTYIKGEFTAKLGIDGKNTTIEQIDEKKYTIEIPPFIFIGFSTPTFEVAVEDNDMFSMFTPEIDQTEMINQILGLEAQQQYIDDYTDILRESAENFYNNIIGAIDPEAELEYVYLD